MVKLSKEIKFLSSIALILLFGVAEFDGSEKKLCITEEANKTLESIKSTLPDNGLLSEIAKNSQKAEIITENGKCGFSNANLTLHYDPCMSNSTIEKYQAFLTGTDLETLKYLAFSSEGKIKDQDNQSYGIAFSPFVKEKLLAVLVYKTSNDNSVANAIISGLYILEKDKCGYFARMTQKDKSSFYTACIAFPIFAIAAFALYVGYDFWTQKEFKKSLNLARTYYISKEKKAETDATKDKPIELRHEVELS